MFLSQPTGPGALLPPVLLHLAVPTTLGDRDKDLDAGQRAPNAARGNVLGTLGGVRPSNELVLH